MRSLSVSLVALLACAPLLPAQAAKPAPVPATLRSTLLAQLRSTHNHAEWFVPLNTAVQGLTAEQARWVPANASGKTDADANHSVGMLAYHLLYWDRNLLTRLRGQKPPSSPKDNEETFNRFDAASWKETVQGLDTVMTDLEQTLEHTDDATLARTAQLYALLATHNAYHTGQILYVRKLQGTWNPENGVK